jgi:multicomponent Na+:H+ antiporter subunit B
MNSLILSTASRYLLPLLVLFSIFILLRGHYEPGGGFIGGLVASSAFALYAIAFGVERTRKIIYIDPPIFLILGLIFAVSSGIISLYMGDPFLTGEWFEYDFPVIGKIGTPLLFDIGVYFVVIGVTLTIILSIAEE